MPRAFSGGGRSSPPPSLTPESARGAPVWPARSSGRPGAPSQGQGFAAHPGAVALHGRGMEAGPQFQVRPGAASAPPASAGVRSGLVFTRSGGGWEDCACKPTPRPGTAWAGGGRGRHSPEAAGRQTRTRAAADGSETAGVDAVNVSTTSRPMSRRSRDLARDAALRRVFDCPKFVTATELATMLVDARQQGVSPANSRSSPASTSSTPPLCPKAAACGVIVRDRDPASRVVRRSSTLNVVDGGDGWSLALPLPRISPAGLRKCVQGHPNSSRSSNAKVMATSWV